MTDNLTNLVRNFGEKRVLLIGDLILDRYVVGDAERISPEAPVPVLRAVETREAVGGAANVAACLAALGCRVSVCGVVGADRHGKTLTTLLTELGADVNGVVAIEDRPTTTKTRLVGLAQHRHRQQLMRLDEEDTTPLKGDLVRQLVELVERLIDQSEVVCIEDYDKGVVSDELAKAVIAKARGRNKPVLVDPARLNSYERYRNAMVITPNREELSIAVGRRLGSIKSVGEAATEVRQKFGFEAVVATVDRDGAVVVERNGNPRHVPTTPRSVYDNTGAGDAVLAMLAAAIAAGADYATAASLANIAGGLEVEKFGCVPISAEEILAELRLSDRMRSGKTRGVDEVVSELRLRRDRGETVAFTNGCFDILHAGHVDFLRRCRQEASLLVVGLNSDESVRSLDKGRDRPVNRFEDRAAVIGALECVDYVVRFDEPTPAQLIRLIRPDVLAKGKDWANKGVVGREFVESCGGRVVLIPLVEGLSTSALIERIRGGGEVRA